MSEFIFTKENNHFIVNTDFNNENVVKLQGIKPNFFYDNLTSNNHIELNENNEAVAPFFEKLATLITNFNDSTSSPQLFLGLFFITLDNPNGKVTKAPLLLVPIKVMEMPNKFKLSLDTTITIKTNPFLSKYLSQDATVTNFENYASLDEYINKISEICINKDYLLKNLSIMGLCLNDTSGESVLDEDIDPSESSALASFLDVENDSSSSFGANLSSFLDHNLNRDYTAPKVEVEEKMPTLTVEESTSVEESPQKTENFDFEKDYEIDPSTQKIDVSKITSKQKEAHLASFQINALSREEKDILFSSKVGQNAQIYKTQKANSFSLISNLALTSLAENKKVLYLTDNANSINELHNQITTDGFEDFVLFVKNGELTNNPQDLFDISKKEVAFKFDEHSSLIDSKNALKTELNDYLKTTHKVFNNMNLTLFDVVTKIISLKSDFNIDKIYDIDIENIIDFTPLDLHRYTFHLNNYVKYFEASQVQLENTFWNKIDFSTVQKDDFSKIESTLGELKTILEHLNTEENTIISSTTGYKPADIKAFYNLYSNTNHNIFNTNYVYNIDHEGIITNLRKLYELQSTFNQYQNDIYSLFDEKIFSSDILTLYGNLEKKLDLVVKNLDQNKYLTNEDILTNIVEINSEAKNLLSFITSIFNTADEFSEYFSLSICNNLDEVKLLIEMFSFVLDNVKINDLWLDKTARDNFIDSAKKSMDLHKVADNKRNKITKHFIPEVLDIDFNSLTAQLGIVKDVKADPVATKIYRYLRTFKRNNKQPVDYAQAQQILADVAEYSQSEAKLNETLLALSKFYNKALLSEEEFKTAISNVKLFDEMLVAFDNNIPENIKNFLSNPSSASHILEDYKSLNEALLSPLVSNEDYKIILKFSKEEMINALNDVVSSSDEAAYIYNKILTYVQSKEDVTLSKITETTYKISSLVEVQEKYETLFENTKLQVPDLLTSIDMNLEGIAEDFEVFKKLKILLNKFEIDENNFYDFAKTIRQEILSNQQRFNYLIEEAIELFKVIFDFANNSTDICQDFENDLNFVTKLQSSFTLAREGYKFAHSDEECKKLGLSSFLNNIHSENLGAHQIINAFLVSFYTEWLKEALMSIDLKGDIDYLEIHKKINEYFEISEKIYAYNKAKLYSDVSKNLPILTTNKSSVDEVNILLEDIAPNKETNFKTIFKKIPNLIFEVKPCLVTSFEDFSKLGIDKNIDFDLVVFDNGSNFDAQNQVLDNISAKQYLIFHENLEQAEYVPTFNTMEFELHDIFAVQDKFNYSLLKFLNKNYFDKRLFIPYTKNFNLEFKNVFVQSDLENNVNEIEANKTLELLQDYYLKPENKNNNTQVVALTAEQASKINGLIITSDVLTEFDINGQILVKELKDVTSTNFNNTIISLCATTIEDFVTLTNDDDFYVQKLATLLLNTLNSLQVVESINFISKVLDENFTRTFKLIFNTVQYFISSDEIYKIEPLNKRDIFAETLVDTLKPEFNIDYTHKNNLTHIFVAKENSVNLMLQSDLVLSNKTDFEDIYLKQMFTKNIDGVKILNVFSYAWYLSDGYKAFVKNEIEKKLNTEFEEKELQLLRKSINADSKSNFFDLVPYEVADMFEIEPVDDITKFVSNAVSHIVSVESPIHSNLVYEKLYSLLGSSSSVINVEEYVNAALSTYLEDEVYIKNDFFWSLKKSVISPRIPSDITTTRHITHIADEELSEIIYFIIKKSYGISLDSLIEACCVELGFTVQSLSIKNSIYSVYENLLTSGKILNLNNKLKIK